jgi:Tol biopolymer transport system component
MAAFAVSDSGVLVYVGGGAEAGENRLVWVDRDGRIRLASAELGSYEWPRISPDGKRVAVTNRTFDGRIDVWLLDLERDARSRLTLQANDILPTWAPDGSRIAFGSVRGDSPVCNVYSKAADGSGEATLLVKSDHPRFPRSWSKDGSRLALIEWHPDSMRDIWILEMTGDRLAYPLIDTPFDELNPVFSPDGRWLAYTSNESGRYEVYVESYPRGRGRWLISAGGGTEPTWSADGREIFYRNVDAMMVVPVQSGSTFTAGAPRMLFERPLKRGIYDSLSYDITADGREFLMIERQSALVPNQLNVVTDWGSELRLKIPAGMD